MGARVLPFCNFWFLPHNVLRRSSSGASLGPVEARNLVGLWLLSATNVRSHASTLSNIYRTISHFCERSSRLSWDQRSVCVEPLKGYPLNRPRDAMFFSTREDCELRTGSRLQLLWLGHLL